MLLQSGPRKLLRCLALSYNQLNLDISHPPDLIKGMNIIYARTN